MPETPKNIRDESLLKSLHRLRFLFNRRDKMIFIFLLVGMIIGAMLETFSIGIIPAFIGAAINPEKIFQYSQAKAVLEFLGITDTRSLILWGCLALLLVFAFKTVFIFLQYYFQVRFVQNRVLRLTRRLFTAYMNAPYTFHIQRNSSELYRNTVQEVNQIMGSVLMPLLTLTMQAAIMTAVLVMLFLIQPLMAMISVLMMGMAGGGFQWMVKKKLINYSQVSQEHRKRMIQAIQQGFGVIKELRILRRERFFIQTLSQSLQQIIRVARFQAVTSKTNSLYMELVALTGLLTITMLLLLTGTQPQSLAPTLALFAVSFIKLKANIGQIVNSVNQLRFGVISIHPVYNDLKELESKKSKTSMAGIGVSRSLSSIGEIRVENVSYRYPGC